MNSIFTKAILSIRNIFSDIRGEVGSPEGYPPSDIREPHKKKRVKIGNTIFVVGTFFSDNGSDTLKDILQRSIKREVSGSLKN